MATETRTIESGNVVELYISATPQRRGAAAEQAKELFAEIAQELRPKNAHILQERIFAKSGTMERISSIRSAVYGELDDGVAPSWLVVSPASNGEIAGVQVHAVSGTNRPEPVRQEDFLCGRILRQSDRSFLTLSGISAPDAGLPTAQARAMLEKAEHLLKQAGGDLRSVARTWMWLEDILSWYGDFNRVRNQFFTERGLIGDGIGRSMPASTGIGLSPAEGGKCSMDLTAVLEPPDSIQYLQAVGKQQCALEYGSAFSRASRAITPAGETVFVSGTASIDASGATTNIGDAPGQINTTIENVRAVLRDMHCRDEDVVQVVAYCKTTEVEKVFNDLKSHLPWPWVTVICDICRPDLLFEIEAAAMSRK